MSSWNYKLSVLASNPAEVRAIAARLNDPSSQLRSLLSERLQLPKLDGFSDVLDFRALQNLSSIEAAVRGFRLTIDDRFCGLVARHLVEVSAAFPRAVFLLETEVRTFSQKDVLRDGHWVQKVECRSHGNPVTGTGMVDIFAPFVAEHTANLPFGSLWGSWLNDAARSLRRLKRGANSASQASNRSEERPCTTAKARAGSRPDTSQQQITNKVSKPFHSAGSGKLGNSRILSRRQKPNHGRKAAATIVQRAH